LDSKSALLQARTELMMSEVAYRVSAQGEQAQFDLLQFTDGET
jgi:hypothetical protein